MMLPKLAQYFGWALLAAIIALGASYLVNSRINAAPGQASVPTRIPTYFITQEETLHNPDGSRVTDHGKEVAWERVYGQRADGARVYINGAKAFLQNAIRDVTFPAKGISIAVNGANNNKTTRGDGVPVDVLKAMRHINYDTCGTGKTLVGVDKIQGFKVLHAIRKDPGQTTEHWYAPALDCMDVRTVATTSGGYTTIEPIILSDKAPDESYFVIREGLTEVDPVTMHLSLGAQSEQLAPRWAERQKQLYEADKARREKQ